MRADVSSLSRDIELLVDEEVVVLRDLSEGRNQIQILKVEMEEAGIRVKVAEKENQEGYSENERSGDRNGERGETNGNNGNGNYDEKEREIEKEEGNETRVKEVAERCKINELNRSKLYGDTMTSHEVRK